MNNAVMKIDLESELKLPQELPVVNTVHSKTRMQILYSDASGT